MTENLNQALHDAAEVADVAEIRTLLKQGADPNAISRGSDFGGCMGLHSYAPLHMVCADRLESARLDYGYTCPEVTEAQRIDACLALLEGGAEVDWRADYTHTPLFFAARDGQAKLCQVLLNHGADVEGGRAEWTKSPLHVAAEHGHLDVCQVVVNAGADESAIYYEPAMTADGCLIESEEGEEPTPLTAFDLSIRHGHKDVIEWLESRRRGAELEVLLTKVAQADDWHPGMTATTNETPACAASSAEQIQTRSRSQGLRF